MHTFVNCIGRDMISFNCARGDLSSSKKAEFIKNPAGKVYLNISGKKNMHLIDNTKAQYLQIFKFLNFYRN